MGLQISFNDQFGNVLSDSYWKIGKYEIDRHAKNATIMLFGFVSKAARDEGKQPFIAKNYRVDADAYEINLAPSKFESSTPEHQMYDYIKANDLLFNNATDA